MEIKPSSSPGPILPVETRATRRATQAASDAGEFTGTEALQRALDATPEVRPEAVAAGKALVESPHYPPDEMLRGLARLFVVEFSTPKRSSDNSPATPTNSL